MWGKKNESLRCSCATLRESNPDRARTAKKRGGRQSVATNNIEFLDTRATALNVSSDIKNKPKQTPSNENKKKNVVKMTERRCSQSEKREGKGEKRNKRKQRTTSDPVEKKRKKRELQPMGAEAVATREDESIENKMRQT